MELCPELYEGAASAQLHEAQLWMCYVTTAQGVDTSPSVEHVRFNETPVKDRLSKPKLLEFDNPGRLMQGYSTYVRPVKERPPIEWLKSFKAELRPVDGNKQATGSVEIVVDRGTLVTIASAPYTSQNGAWRMVCFMRRGRIYLVEDRKYAKERMAKERPVSNGKLPYAEEYMLQMLRLLLTSGGYDPKAPVDGNNTYNHIMTAPLKRGTSTFLLRYSVQVESIESHQSYRPVEIRIEDLYREHDDAWWLKALEWHLESRLSGARILLVGERQHHSNLVGVTQLPVEHLSKMAAEFGQWSPHVCFNFLAEVLQEVQEQLARMEDFAPVLITNDPREDQLKFSSAERGQLKGLVGAELLSALF